MLYWFRKLFPPRGHAVSRRTATRLLRSLEARTRPGEGSAPLRIVFIDRSLAYTVQSVYDEPLGGSQSAACYLSEALAAAGHEIVLVTMTETPGKYRGVVCTGWDHTPPHALRDLRPDAVVVFMSARYGQELRALFGDETRLILWSQHAHDQPPMQALADPEERGIYDGIALASEWQKQEFIKAFQLDAARIRVLGNAVSPAFRDLFESVRAIDSAKDQPPVLAYTSTPYRGLRSLLQVFPEIRRRVPGTRLRVFSSMRVYQIPVTQDESEFGELYRQCRETEGVEYVGSLPQAKLAGELRAATVLAYPNTFAETYCTVAIEAMAAGCRVVTSALGALPETTAGYGRLVQIIGRKDTYAHDFTDAVVETLEAARSGADQERIVDQVAYVNRECTWDIRAAQWLEWLASMPPGKDA